MTQPVVFSYQDWTGAFPELSSVGQLKAQFAFNAACIRIDNTLDPDLIDDSQRETILYLLTAHIALLMAQAVSVQQATDANGNPIAGSTVSMTPGISGRVSSATEGSVSVSSESFSKAGASSLENWLNSTQYGALVWQMIAPLFAPFYVPGPDRSGYLLP